MSPFSQTIARSTPRPQESKESLCPRVLQQGPSDASCEQVEQRIANPDAEEDAKKTRLPTQASCGGEQGGTHGRNILLHEREQAKRCRLCHGHPIVKAEREPVERRRRHRVGRFALCATVEGATPKCSGSVASISRAMTEMRA
jgi:hypothetical protein